MLYKITVSNYYGSEGTEIGLYTSNLVVAKTVIEALNNLESFDDYYFSVVEEPEESN